MIELLIGLKALPVGTKVRVIHHIRVNLGGDTSQYLLFQITALTLIVSWIIRLYLVVFTGDSAGHYLFVGARSARCDGRIGDHPVSFPLTVVGPIFKIAERSIEKYW